MTQTPAPDGPLVSVVIPAYNHARYVEQAVRSVLGQTYPRVELVVVDDGSTDGTFEVLRRVHAETGGAFALYRKANGGVSSTLNYGIRRTSGELVGTLASDDYYLPDKTAVQVAALVALGPAALGPAGALVHGAALDDSGDGRLVDTSGRPGAVAEGACFEGLLCDDVHVLAPSAVYPRAAYDAVGGYDEGLATEDVDFYARLAWHGCRFHYVPRALLVKRSTGQNLSRDVEANYRSHVQTLENFRGLVSADLYERARVRLLVSRGRNAAAFGDVPLAVRSFVAAARAARSPRPLADGFRLVARSVALGALPGGVRSRLRTARATAHSPRADP